MVVGGLCFCTLYLALLFRSPFCLFILCVRVYGRMGGKFIIVNFFIFYYYCIVVRVEGDVPHMPLCVSFSA